jgi:hypothetical protein
VRDGGVISMAARSAALASVDPFGGSGCVIGPSIALQASMERLRRIARTDTIHVDYRAKPAGASSALLQTRGVMDRLKLWTVTLRKNVGLLAWAVVMAFVMTLIMYGVMFAASYVSDKFYSPSLNEASFPPPRTDGR